MIPWIIGDHFRESHQLKLWGENKQEWREKNFTTPLRMFFETKLQIRIANPTPLAAPQSLECLFNIVRIAWVRFPDDLL
jgi:hypothetical protein